MIFRLIIVGGSRIQHCLIDAFIFKMVTDLLWPHSCTAACVPLSLDDLIVRWDKVLTMEMAIIICAPPPRQSCWADGNYDDFSTNNPLFP